VREKMKKEGFEDECVMSKEEIEIEIETVKSE
jgi:hypothetical protein